MWWYAKHSPTPSPRPLSKEVHLFFVASVDTYISSKLQVGLEFKLSRIHQASVMPPIPCHPHPSHPPLPGRCMRRGVVLSQGLTRLTALTRNLHLRENIFPFYENIAQFCHKKFYGICDSCLNGLSDHVLGPFRGQTPLCLANISITTSVYKVQHEAAEVVST